MLFHLSLRLTIATLLTAICFALLLICSAYPEDSQYGNTAEAATLSIQKDGDRLFLCLDIADSYFVYSNDPGSTGLPFKVTLKDNVSANIANFSLKWPPPQIKREHINSQNVDIMGYTGFTVIEILANSLNEKMPSHMVLDITYGACSSTGCQQASESIVYDVSLPAHSNSFYSILITCFLAFIGGIVLNLMPCVLPVVSIKLWQLVQYRGLATRSIRLHLLSTFGGVLSSFMVLASINIIFRAIGKNVGWGFHFQSPIFTISIIIALWFVILNMFDLLTVALPPKFQNYLNGMGTKESYGSSFISGIVLTLLATPCTAPFLSTALAFALSQPSSIIIVIYFFISLGMSLPYLIVLYNPHWLKKLPRSSRHGMLVKKLLSMPIIATICWLLYVLFSQGCRNLLLLSISMVSATFILLYYKKSRSSDRWLSFKLNKAALGVIGVSLIASVLAFTIDLSRFGNKIAWHNFHQKEIDRFTSEGKTVLVNITASWCITCKVNEFRVLDNKKIVDYINKHDVVALRGDYTTHSPEIQRYLAVNHRYGIPTNVVYGPKNPQGIILPEILSTQSVLDALTKASG